MNSINQLFCRFQYNVIIHFEHPCQLVGNFGKINFYLLFVGSYKYGIEITLIMELPTSNISWSHDGIVYILDKIFHLFF